MEPTETPLETAARHELEGEERISKQRALIAELERDNHPALVPGAWKLLAELEASQELIRAGLRRERDKAASTQTPEPG